MEQNSRRVSLKLVVLIACVFSSTLSQTELPNALFLHANVGEYFAIFPLKESTPRSNLTYGGGFGIQLSNYIIIDAKLAYYSHSGVPLVHYYDSNGNGHLDYNGNSRYQQWLYFISLYYKIVNEEYLMASVGGGLMFSKMNETKVSVTYDYYSENHSNNIKGGFLGGELELRIPDQPLSIVADTQFGYSTGDRSYIEGITNTDTFAGFNSTIGIRYYVTL